MIPVVSVGTLVRCEEPVAAGCFCLIPWYGSEPLGLEQLIVNHMYERI